MSCVELNSQQSIFLDVISEWWCVCGECAVLNTLKAVVIKHWAPLIFEMMLKKKNYSISVSIFVRRQFR